MSSVVVKSIDEAAVRRAMDAYAADLLRRPEVDEVVVFGSFAVGSYAPGSDLDVLIVLRATELPVWERPGAYRPRTFPVPLDLFPFTHDELAARADAPFAQALASSRWRYGTPRR